MERVKHFPQAFGHAERSLESACQFWRPRSLDSGHLCLCCSIGMPSYVLKTVLKEVHVHIVSPVDFGTGREHSSRIPLQWWCARNILVTSGKAASDCHCEVSLLPKNKNRKMFSVILRNVSSSQQPINCDLPFDQILAAFRFSRMWSPGSRSSPFFDVMKLQTAAPSFVKEFKIAIFVTCSRRYQVFEISVYGGGSQLVFLII